MPELGAVVDDVGRVALAEPALADLVLGERNPCSSTQPDSVPRCVEYQSEYRGGAFCRVDGADCIRRILPNIAPVPNLLMRRSRI
jgi:hypothetical protein